MIRAVLLDFYGTLVHEDDAIIQEICERIHRSSSGSAAKGDIAHLWWTSFSALCSRSGAASFLTQRDLALQSLVETMQQVGATEDPEELIGLQYARWIAPPIFPDTRPFLESLPAPVCVVSNIDRADVEAAIAFHQLPIEHLVTSDDAQAYKPRREMFDLALRKLDRVPNEVLHVGDSGSSDIVGARNLGIPVAWINRAGKSAPLDPEPDFIVRNLREVLEIVEARAGIE